MEQGFKPLKLMGEVMALAYLVNEATEYCTMIRYSGHVNALHVIVLPDKDNWRADCIYETEFYVDGRHENDPEKRLLELKTVLEGYLLPNVESTRP